MTNSCGVKLSQLASSVWSECETDGGKSSQSSLFLQVRFAQRTFDAEGVESPGRFFSRRISFPGGTGSGVTIGRGYDMGRRSSEQVFRELTRAGVQHHDAQVFSSAAGIRGAAAKQFVAKHRQDFPVISLGAQKRLFEEVVTPDIVADIKRIFEKPDTVRAYGHSSWETLPNDIKELVFDLRYRGDYTPVTRKRIQPLLSNHDYDGLKRVINDTSYWTGLGVPRERIRERQTMVSLL